MCVRAFASLGRAPAPARSSTLPKGGKWLRRCQEVAGDVRRHPKQTEMDATVPRVRSENHAKLPLFPLLAMIASPPAAALDMISRFADEADFIDDPVV